MYLRALSHDDDVERCEESSQNGTQISHKIIALGTMHLEEKNYSRGIILEDYDERFFEIITFLI